MEKSSKTRQKMKSLIFIFFCFLTAIAKVFLLLVLIYQISNFVYLCWIGPILKYCKVPRYSDQDCRSAGDGNMSYVNLIEKLRRIDSHDQRSLQSSCHSVTFPSHLRYCPWWLHCTRWTYFVSCLTRLVSLITASFLCLLVLLQSYVNCKLSST